MKICVVFALILCACAAEVKEKQDKTEAEQNKDKRQTQGEFVPSLPVHLLYRTSRKQEPVAPVEEPQDDDGVIISSRADAEQYRPGQVFSLNPQELLDLQPERKAPLTSSNLQQLYTNPQQDHRQNLQQIYYLEPQTARQVGAQSGSSTVAPLAYQPAPYQSQVTPQQSLQQLILQTFGQQVGAPAPLPTPALPVKANLHQLSNNPEDGRREYLTQLINLLTLLSQRNNVVSTSFAPPQYSTNAPSQYSTNASPHYFTNAPYSTPQTVRISQPAQYNNPQVDNQQVFYLQTVGGQVFASTSPRPILLVGDQQANRYYQAPQPRRPDLQQLLLLQALAQTTPAPAASLAPAPSASLAPAPFTSTQSIRANYHNDTPQSGQQPVVSISSNGHPFKLQSTSSPLLETAPIPSHRQLQELDTNEPSDEKLKQLYLINALQEPEPQSKPVDTQNTTSGITKQLNVVNALQELQSRADQIGKQNTTSEVLPEVTPTAQVENTQTTSKPSTKEEQVASHAVIARPHYSSNGGEASVGAALSVSDTGVNPPESFDQELLALLGQPVRPDAQTYQPQTVSVAPQYQQVAPQTVAPQYQQIDRYLTKPSKKPTKLRPKVHSVVSPPQSSAAPQQYLIETTNVQQQPQYRPAIQPQRAPQALRYVPSSQAFAQQALYERPESQGVKVVAAPKLQQAQPPLGYRLLQSYAQPEVAPKQYRILEVPRAQAIRPEQRVPASSIERPVTYLNRYPDTEKMRAVKIYDPVPQDTPQQSSAQLLGEQYYLRPVYRTNELRDRYQPAPSARPEQPRVLETSKPHSSIYVSKNLAPKKAKSQSPKEPSSSEQVEEQRGQSIEERRAQLPPPKNNRAYTPEEFAALVAAGYSVTPIPVAPLGHPGHPVHPVAQSRSSAENASAPISAPSQRRPLYARRHQRLHLSRDDAP